MSVCSSRLERRKNFFSIWILTFHCYNILRFQFVIQTVFSEIVCFYSCIDYESFLKFLQFVYVTFFSFLSSKFTDLVGFKPRKANASLLCKNIFNNNRYLWYFILSKKSVTSQVQWSLSIDLTLDRTNRANVLC